MSSLLRKGLWVAVLHVAIVASLAVKLVVDRATRPRVWARAAPADPELPVRGRYVSLRVEASIGHGLDFPENETPSRRRPDLMRYQPNSLPNSLEVALAATDQQLVAVRPSGSTGLYARAVQRDGRRVAVLDAPIAYFIPEHVADPSRRSAGEELWVEVTIPRKGGPRPIRLGVKKDGILTPLEFN